MDHIQVLLLVDVFELGVPKAHLCGLVVELVLAPGEVESIRGRSWAPSHEHVIHAGIITRAVAPELAGVERKVFHFP
ncbi:hypothetical protein D3C72_711430 [compost metagenome]